MPSADFHLPDDFPDLTIPDKTPEPPRPATPVPSARISWKEGDRVLAPWEPEFLYVGVIRQINDGQALIQFGDGDAGWVFLNQIRPLVVRAGQKVFSRRNMGLNYPGEILEVRGEEVCVGFDDGREEEWTTLSALRIPCQASGPAAAPAKVASQQAFFDNLRPGDRVWAPWNTSTLFAGTVDKVREREVHIHFDDGDRGWVLREQVLPLDIPVGLRVVARRKMGRQYHPGTVTEVDGDRVHVQYDDGNQEWTTPGALVLVTKPFGPDARPTKVVSSGSPAMGWLIPIGIGLLLAFLRAGCR